MKTCGQCNKSKDDEQFHRRAMSKDGLAACCKDCQSTYDAARLYQPDRVRARAEYKTKPEGIARIRAGQKRYIERNPLKRHAHTTFDNAVTRGKIKVPDQCQTPGCASTGPLEGHHDDYTKPLEVRWLCTQCHIAHHMAERIRLREDRIAA